ncbi:HAD family hydrolase [Mycolicibacter minnesotensis]
MGNRISTSANERPKHVTDNFAVLFDVDGTLVDSNYLHVQAWHRAFCDRGQSVESWRIHRAIGMDGSELIGRLWENASGDVLDQLKDSHSHYYAQSAPLLSTLPGARLLLKNLHDSGFSIVLATSAPDDELATLRKVLDCDDLIAAVTSSADVEVAKPDPSIIDVALEKVGVATDHAVFVGDAVWDVQACVRAGLPCIGLLSGGFSRDELETAGAVMVFDNAADLLSDVGHALGAALPRWQARR